MGKRAKFLRALKKVFNHESKKSGKSKEKSEIGKFQMPDTSGSVSLEAAAPFAAVAPATAVVPRHEEVKIVELDHGQGSQVDTVVAEVVLRRIESFGGKSREEVAAIKIQTAFRGYLARRALRALKGLVRLKSLVHGNSVKRQATTTLRCMQTLARVQSQIRSRRIRMSEENQALQRQLLLKRERELENLAMGEEWDDSLQSKEQIEASLFSKQEAAIKRERALAYAFSHQWKNSSKSANPLFMDPNNPHWGWSWLERWMAARPWEGRSTSDKNANNDRSSVKSTSLSIGGEMITNSYARRDTNTDKVSPAIPKSVLPASRHSPSTPKPKATTAAGKLVKSASPRRSWVQPEDDLKSMISMQSGRQRRHSVAGSSVRDDESVASLASSQVIPSFMAPTESARAKSRIQAASVDKIEGSPDSASVASVKKRLSFPVGEKHSATSPAGVRRHSGPPKVGAASVKGGATAVHPEHHLNNGGSN